MSECCNSCDTSRNYGLLMVPQILSVVNVVLAFFAGPNSISFFATILLMIIHMIQCCFVNRIMVSVLAVLCLVASWLCYAQAGDKHYFIFAPPVNYLTGTFWLACFFCEFCFVYKTCNEKKSDEDEVVPVATLVKAEEADVAIPVVATLVETEEDV